MKVIQSALASSIVIKYVFALTLFPLNLTAIRQTFAESPLVKSASNLAGDVVASVGKYLTEIPLATARAAVLARGIDGKEGYWLQGAQDFLNSPLGGLRDRLSNHFADVVRPACENEDAKLRIEELINKYGYPVEIHEVETPDGYILTLHRIPHERSFGNVSSIGRPAVFLMHGLLSSSDDWIITGPEKSLAYILADAGYDVWMGNARGNMHSRRHVDLNPAQQLFWKFSWDEIGNLDLPAMIDYVLEITKEEKLFYLGHSQGTTVFFVMCSLRPEYNDKIRIMFALSPVAWMTNVVSPLVRMFAPESYILGWALETLGTGEFLPNNLFMSAAGGLLCRDRAITQAVCSNILFLACGFNLDQLNSSILPVIAGHSPAGAAVRQLTHFGQGVLSRRFRRFDHGSIVNTQQYGSEDTPDYNLNNITAPVSLFYSQNDWLAHPDDVDTLYNQLNSAIEIYKVPHGQFNHLDFLWATNAREIIYDRVMKIMKDF